jgi:hypothetical protein
VRIAARLEEITESFAEMVVKFGRIAATVAWMYATFGVTAATPAVTRRNDERGTMNDEVKTTAFYSSFRVSRSSFYFIR